MEKVKEVMGNLCVSNLEIYSHDDPEVRPYTHTTLQETVVCPLPPRLKSVEANLLNVGCHFARATSLSLCMAAEPLLPRHTGDANAPKPTFGEAGVLAEGS